MRTQWLFSVALAMVLSLGNALNAADWGLEKGTANLKSAGPLAFGPDGILLVADTKAATVFAIDTADASGEPAKAKFNIPALNEKIAAALSVEAPTIIINDLIVNPASGNLFASISANKKPAIVKIDTAGKITQLALEAIPFASVALPNAPEDKEVGEGRRRGNPRDESITEIAYTDGKILVSGVSTNPDGGRPLSTVRELPFPLTAADSGINIEIYHAAHGRDENTATVRTFVPFNIDGKPSLLAGFTCTPLVRFDLKTFKSKKPVKGTTVAELGNRNQPYDMIVYEKNGKTWLLMANSARGVMKISTEDIGRDQGLEDKVSGGGVAGQKFETIKELEGTVQLDKLNDTSAIILVKGDSGSLDLSTVELP